MTVTQTARSDQARDGRTGRRRACASRIKPRVACLDAAALALAATTGCTAQRGAGEQPPVPNWKDPGGIAVASAAAAQKHVPFRVRLLPGPPPYRILVTRPPGTAIVVLQYRQPFGLVDIWGERQQITSRQFRHLITQWVALNGNPGTSGTSTSVHVRRRYPARITATADGRRSDIRWIQAGVEYLIRGPRSPSKTPTPWPARLVTPVVRELAPTSFGLAGPRTDRRRNSTACSQDWLKALSTRTSSRLPPRADVAPIRALCAGAPSITYRSYRHP